VSDAGRRLAARVTQLVIDGHADAWIAARLSDGGDDGVVYESRRDAVSHQLHESQCAYVKLPWDGMSERAAMTFLDFNRRCHDAGFRMTDPDIEPIMPSERERL
jgi:hypothetical protein